MARPPHAILRLRLHVPPSWRGWLVRRPWRQMTARRDSVRVVERLAAWLIVENERRWSPDGRRIRRGVRPAIESLCERGIRAPRAPGQADPARALRISARRNGERCALTLEHYDGRELSASQWRGRHRELRLQTALRLQLEPYTAILDENPLELIDRGE